jgi:hypothetical protein
VLSFFRISGEAHPWILPVVSHPDVAVVLLVHGANLSLGFQFANAKFRAAWLHIEALIKRGHFDLRFAKSRRERLHGVLLPVGKERARGASTPMPFQQLSLIGVG